MITLQSRLRIAKDILSHDIDGEAVILNLQTGVYFGLDAVGTRVWQLLGQHHCLTHIIDRLLDEYEVAHTECEADLLSLIRDMQEHQLLEAIP